MFPEPHHPKDIEFQLKALRQKLARVSPEARAFAFGLGVIQCRWIEPAALISGGSNQSPRPPVTSQARVPRDFLACTAFMGHGEDTC